VRCGIEGKPVCDEPGWACAMRVAQPPV
jgi:hypothetical protein